MRKIILSVFILLNIIAIIVTLSHPLTVSYFSLRVICVALTFVLSLFFSLIRTSRFDTILSIISIFIALIHIGIIAQSTYQYLY
ncbi:hypothetical protein WL278_05855 [Staphylococcus caprae]|uniref:hypothetical protein n=1 Tax=Staphylococcus TaxID=1279 RepID=UPI0009BAC0F3|nr:MULTISPECIES: hypothetical protein [Staphylococcus]HCG74791.1 hypothetical protein [Staphylococcus sp.]PAK64191.1 hypothetical protein B9K00_07290 [Staphylococcus caprae]POA07491.1 hypothetical protein CD155_01385 [Staphylococcus caprae]QDW93329.1 hypothetical protein DWB96_03435 [Staphylococcus caprae]RIM35768.1 hypothetical protein BU631_02015 [Staphylococcus caprae]